MKIIILLCFVLLLINIFCYSQEFKCRTFGYGNTFENALTDARIKAVVQAYNEYYNNVENIEDSIRYAIANDPVSYFESETIVKKYYDKDEDNWEVLLEVFIKKSAFSGEKSEKEMFYLDSKTTPNEHYINPYLNLLGGERVGLQLVESINLGISFGIGFPYGGINQSNFYDINIHALGFSAGIFSDLPSFLTSINKKYRHNDILNGSGIQFSYVIPYLKIIKIQYQKILNAINEEDSKKFIDESKTINSSGEIYYPTILSGDFINGELFIPFVYRNSKNSRFYFAYYEKEIHLGLSTYDVDYSMCNLDFKVDFLVDSDKRFPQVSTEILFSDIMYGFGKYIGIGPSLCFSKIKDNKIGLLKAFVNLRIKII